MGYKRVDSIKEYPAGNDLTKKLIGIGFKIGGRAEYNSNIEDSLIGACIEGVSGDYRTLSLLTDWLIVHFRYVNTDRLYRALKNISDEKVRCYFSAIGFNFSKFYGYKKLVSLYSGKKILLGDDPFLIKRNGEDERFKGSKLMVAAKLLRSRPDDILSTEQLAKIHQDYYYRVLIGPSYRADMISTFLRNPSITPTELARNTYGSFASAWEIIKEITPIMNEI